MRVSPLISLTPSLCSSCQSSLPSHSEHLFQLSQTTATAEAMSRQADPFDDILQPQPRHPQQSTVADNPFDQDGSPNLFDDHNGAYGGHAGQSSSHVASSSRDAGRQHGYALDPFFDE